MTSKVTYLAKMITKEELIAFEEKIRDLYSRAEIRAPIHLSKGNEDALIEIFKGIKKEDWVFTTYRNHYHALLKGMSPEWLEREIREGRSMHVMSAEDKFYTTSIVAGHIPIALGAAMALKRKGSPNHVWAFCGDMAAETGVFHESTKYAACHKLPITFIVEDNGLSVDTPTRKVWGVDGFNGQVENYVPVKSLEEAVSSNPVVLRYNYTRGWPHHGIGMWIEFPEEKTRKPIEGEQSDIPLYASEVKRAMKILAADERTVFLGQTVGYKGSPVYQTLEGIAEDKRIELPVMEETQMGISTGMALEDYVPVSIFPRFDFLILATNQLVNHLDKTNELSEGRFNPNVIVRTMIGNKEPLNPGPQHYQDHTEAFRKMLTHVNVVKLESSRDIVPAYEKALHGDKPSLIIEPVDLYNYRR